MQVYGVRAPNFSPGVLGACGPSVGDRLPEPFSGGTKSHPRTIPLLPSVSVCPVSSSLRRCPVLHGFAPWGLSGPYMGRDLGVPLVLEGVGSRSEVRRPHLPCVRRRAVGVPCCGGCSGHHPHPQRAVTESSIGTFGDPSTVGGTGEERLHPSLDPRGERRTRAGRDVVGGRNGVKVVSRECRVGSGGVEGLVGPMVPNKTAGSAKEHKTLLSPRTKG